MEPLKQAGIGRYVWLVLLLATLSQWSNALAAGVISPLAPLFQPELGLSKAEVGFFSSAIFAGSWAVLLVAGSITDRVGVRRVMSSGQVVAGVVLLSMAVVGTFYQAVAVMFVVGMARGAVLPGSTKAIMDWFPPSIRGSAMGLKQTGVPVAGIATAALLPLLGLAVGWRYAVAAAGVAIIAGGVVTGALYRDPVRPSRSGRPGSGLREGLGQLLRNPDIWTVSAIAFLFVVTQLSLIAYIPLYFSDVVLVDAVPDASARIVAAGLFLAVCQAGGVVGRVMWGMISDRTFRGRRTIVLAITGGVTAVVALAMGFVSVATPVWALGVLVLVLGLTSIGYNGVYHALMAETAGAKYAATGVGLSMSLSQLGLIGGPPLFGYIVDISGSYTPAWMLLAASSAGGGLIALLTSFREGKRPEK